MRYILSAVLIILLIVLCVYVAVLNPDTVDISLPLVGTFLNVPLILVLLSSMLSGVCLSFGFVLAKEMRRSFNEWGKTRKTKRHKLVDDQYTEGQQMLAGGHADEAISHFNKLLNKEPQHVPAHVVLGDIYYAAGDWDKATHYHSRALELNGKNADIMLKLGQDYQQAGRIDGAIDVLQKILQANGNNLTALNRLKELYCNQGHWNKAYELQQQLVNLAKSKKQKTQQQQALLGLKYEMASTKASQGKQQEAIKALKEIVKQDKQFLPAYIQLVDIYQQQQEWSSAYQLIEKAYRQNSSLILLKRLEELSLMRNDPQRAIRAYRQAIQVNPQDSSPCLFLGMLYLKLEMLKEAEEQFQYLIQQGKDFPLVHYELARVQERQKDYEKSCKEYKHAFKAQEKELLRYACVECGVQLFRWEGRCHHCGCWNSISWQV